MKRAIVLSLVLAVGAGSALNASAAKVKDPSVQCRYRRAGRWADRDVRAAIRCAVGKWNVSGGPRKALCIANRESGFDEHNRNSSSSAAGVFQFISGTWSSVKQHYREVMRRYGLSDRVENARANVMLAIRFAHAGGWGPWSVNGLC